VITPATPSQVHKRRVDEVIAELQATAERDQAPCPDDVSSPAREARRSPVADLNSQATATCCTALANIAQILDEVRAKTGRVVGRVVEIVIHTAGAPQPMAALVGAVVARVVAGRLLRPIRSLANVLRLTGMALCATDGRHLGDCQCARDLAKDLIKQVATETAKDLAARMYEAVTVGVGGFGRASGYQPQEIVLTSAVNSLPAPPRGNEPVAHLISRAEGHTPPGVLPATKPAPAGPTQVDDGNEDPAASCQRPF
jgi:hypothetical protein